MTRRLTSDVCFLPTTDTIAGSEERLLILRQRVAARKATRHPKDRAPDALAIPVQRERNGALFEQRKAAIPLLGASEALTRPGGSPPKKFCTLLRLARKRKGLTHRQLGFLAGCSASEVSRLERNARHPTMDLLIGLARALGVTLLFGSDEVTI